MDFGGVVQLVPSTAIDAIVNTKFVNITSPASVHHAEIKSALSGAAQIHSGSDKIGFIISNAVSDFGVISTGICTSSCTIVTSSYRPSIITFGGPSGRHRTAFKAFFKNNVVAINAVAALHDDVSAVGG